jgi:hypothetical protein
MGGGKRLDVRFNLISLCHLCHQKAHASQIERLSLLRFIAQRENKSPDEIMGMIYQLQRQRPGLTVRRDKPQKETG